MGDADAEKTKIDCDVRVKESEVRNKQLIEDNINLRTEAKFQQEKGLEHQLQERDFKMQLVKDEVESKMKKIEQLKEELSHLTEKRFSLESKLQMTLEKQSTLQQELSEAKQNAANSKDLDESKKVIQELKQDKSHLQQQIGYLQKQNDENLNLYNTLVGTLRQKSAKEDSEIRSIIEINESLKQMYEKEEQRNLEQMNRIDVLKNYKYMVKSSIQMQCGNCRKQYSTQYYRAHVKKCEQQIIEANEEGAVMSFKPPTETENNDPE